MSSSREKMRPIDRGAGHRLGARNERKDMTHSKRLGFATLALAAGCAQATDIQVPADWPTIQQGIAAAEPGDRVLVAPGVYFEQVDFKGKDIQVIGTGGASVTVIDGGGAGTVVSFLAGETQAAMLSGFTVRNGDADNGGGIQILGDASPTIQDNDIQSNRYCSRGGGVYIDTNGNPRIVRNHIHSNRVRDSCPKPSTAGGGVGVSIRSGAKTQAEIVDNLIEHNSAGSGAGVSASSYGVVIGRNIIRFNSSASATGISLTLFGGESRVFDNVVTANSGGGISMDVFGTVVRAALVNNTLADNTGRVELDFGPPIAAEADVTFVNNIVRTSAARTMATCTGDVDFRNNLFHASNGAKVSGCDISNGLVTDDPRFVDAPGLHAYWLAPGSPAIDAGDDGAVERIHRDRRGAPRIMGDAVDLGAYESSDR
jgi:hypothetical protein